MRQVCRNCAFWRRPPHCAAHPQAQHECTNPDSPYWEAKTHPAGRCEFGRPRYSWDIFADGGADPGDRLKPPA